MKEIILASSSPRRKQLLEQAGIPYRVCPSQVEEKVTTSIPEKVVEELSFQKCEEVLSRMPEGSLVLGADTVVAFEGKILGKPADAKGALAMLSMLQGNTHQVYTGVTLMKKKDGRIWRETFHECTDVTFYPVSSKEIDQYIATGEPMDKAGAYGIQGRFAVFVQKIRGDYNNVVGLPVAAVYQRLKEKLKEDQEEIRKSCENVQYTIRAAREEDLVRIAEIEAECFPAAEAAGFGDFEERFRTCRESFFVAETEEGKLAGFCNGCCADTDDLADEFYHDASLHHPEGVYQMIFGLDVAPEYRKQGIGEALMRAMIESAENRRKKAVVLTCKEHMIPFYRRIGYQYVELSDSVHGGASWHKMIYKIEEESCGQ